jgi:uncharacterized protein (TIGR03435 family)
MLEFCRGVVVYGAGLVLLAGVGLGQGIVAQVGAASQVTTIETKPLAFDVVSIRPQKSGQSDYGFGATPTGFHMDAPMVIAVLTAYTPAGGNDSAFYSNDRVVGLPEWAHNEFYNVEAKVSEDDLDAWKEPALQTGMLRAMLQTMLRDRCKLTVHRDTKEVSVYSLVVGKGGPKFKESVADAPHPAGMPLPGGAVVVLEGNNQMHFYGAQMESLAAYLSNVAGRPVQDKTGLKGRYDFVLQRPSVGAGSAEPGASAQPGAGSVPDPGPSVFAVLEDGLGLKLEAAKGSVDTLVIDHIERPSENQRLHKRGGPARRE